MKDSWEPGWTDHRSGVGDRRKEGWREGLKEGSFPDTQVFETQWCEVQASLAAQMVKNLPAMQEIQV